MAVATDDSAFEQTALMSTEPKVVEEEEEVEEVEDGEDRQAKLLRAQEQLQKCVAEADYRGAAAAQESIDALMSARPCSQTATGPIASSATLSRHADAKRVVGEKEHKRRAKLLRAQEHLEKCVEEKDYKGAAAAK